MPCTYVPPSCSSYLDFVKNLQIIDVSSIVAQAMAVELYEVINSPPWWIERRSN
jgi:hypothetical protein